MADPEAKVAENVEGEFYVDEECIACALCVDEAPENFVMTDSEDYAYVNKQPENEEEREQCQEALESCPVDAIGDDG